MPAVIRGVVSFGILVAAVFPGASTRGAETGAHTLRYQFKAGDTRHYVMDQKLAMKLNVSGNDTTMDMNQTVDVTWHVVSVGADGKATLTQRLDRIRVSMSGAPLGKMDYDSKDGKLPEGGIGQTIGPVFQALAGLEITLVSDTRGRIGNLKVPPKLADAVKNVAGGGLQQMFSEENLKKMTGAGVLVLPEGPVTKGKTWENSTDMKLPFGTMKVTVQATDLGPVERNGHQVEKIAVRPTLTMVNGDSSGGISIKLKEQEGKGMAYFDNPIGQLIEMEINQTMKLEVNAGGQDILQTIVQKTSMKLQDK